MPVLDTHGLSKFENSNAVLQPSPKIPTGCVTVMMTGSLTKLSQKNGHPHHGQARADGHLDPTQIQQPAKSPVAVFSLPQYIQRSRFFSPNSLQLRFSMLSCPPCLECCVRLAGLVFLLSPILSSSWSGVSQLVSELVTHLVFSTWSGKLCPPSWLVS